MGGGGLIICSIHMGANREILVIEDDDDLRDVLVEVLKVGGYEAYGVENGQVALERLRQDPLPCVMLVDLNMPVMNGWKFMERCDQDPRLRDIPRIVISVFAEQLRKVRAHAHLPKPVDLQNIIRLVEKMTAEGTGNSASP